MTQTESLIEKLEALRESGGKHGLSNHGAGRNDGIAECIAIIRSHTTPQQDALQTTPVCINSSGDVYKRQQDALEAAAEAVFVNSIRGVGDWSLQSSFVQGQYKRDAQAAITAYLTHAKLVEVSDLHELRNTLEAQGRLRTSLKMRA